VVHLLGLRRHIASSARVLSASLVLFVLALVSGCSASPPGQIGVSAVSSSVDDTVHQLPASSDGLVVARHQHCDVGSVILHYLETGDNQGNPRLDQRFAIYVHVPLPQARALADQYIESCDQNIDRQDQAAQQAVIRSEQLAAQQAEIAQRFEQQKVEQARARAELHSRELVMCNSVGGRLENERCYSTVKGDPSGKPGADCTSMNGTPIWLSFAKSGEFLSGFYSTTKTFYPGCFR
jgi:hypothetical protein